MAGFLFFEGGLDMRGHPFIFAPENAELTPTNLVKIIKQQGIVVGKTVQLLDGSEGTVASITPHGSVFLGNRRGGFYPGALTIPMST